MGRPRKQKTNDLKAGDLGSIRKIKTAVAYTDALPEKLLKHMSEGFSFESFAGVIECASITLYRWLRIHPEFRLAKNIGEAKALLWWERTLKKGVFTGTGQFCNVGLIIFTLKTRFDQIEKNWLKHVPRPDKELEAVSDDQIIESMKAAIQKYESEKELKEANTKLKEEVAPGPIIEVEDATISD